MSTPHNKGYVTDDGSFEVVSSGDGTFDLRRTSDRFVLANRPTREYAIELARRYERAEKIGYCNEFGCVC
jgi:hypothetical protein